MKRKLISNNQAEGMLKLVVVLIGVMMAIAIGAIISFAMLSATNTAYEVQDTHVVWNYLIDQYVNLSSPYQTGTFSVLTYNGTYKAVAANQLTENANQTLKVAAAGLNANATQLVVTYDMRGSSVNDDIITYAIIVFGLFVIIPLVIVGGIMLRSLGYFGGSKV